MRMIRWVLALACVGAFAGCLLSGESGPTCDSRIVETVALHGTPADTTNEYDGSGYHRRVFRWNDGRAVCFEWGSRVVGGCVVNEWFGPALVRVSRGSGCQPCE